MSDSKSDAVRPECVRLGIVGLGNMGKYHAKLVGGGGVFGMDLAAVCDRDPVCLEQWSPIPSFSTSRDLIRSGKVNAVLIATPHVSHPSIAIDALRNGLHVLVEKPVAVAKAEAVRMIRAHQGTGLVFAAMFNQRTDPFFRKVREMVSGGELGVVRRVAWTVTDWFRTEAYYQSGDWRATWEGEGGGVLLNQAVHNLDLFQWIFGMPESVKARCLPGKYHDIEVEDEVAAIFGYADGTTATFTTSTGEAPGLNRLEVAGENGLLVLEDGALRFRRNEIAMSNFSRASAEGYLRPATWDVAIPLGTDRGTQHTGILKNFADAILRGRPLIAPAADGLASIELINAILMSGFEDRTVRIPISGETYRRFLSRLIAQAKGKRKSRRVRNRDGWKNPYDFGPSKRV